MAQRIIFFLTGNTPTVDEQAAIAKLTAATEPLYTLAIRRADLANETFNYGAGKEPADWVAGDVIPTPYAGVDVMDPDNIPGFGGGGGGDDTAFRYYRYVPMQKMEEGNLCVVGKVFLSRDPSADEDTQTVPTGPELAPQYPISALVDADITTGWAVVGADPLDADVYHATFDYGTARTNVRLRCKAMANLTLGVRMPIGFDILGSNDLTTWETLLSIRDEAAWTVTEENNGEERIYEIGG